MCLFLTLGFAEYEQHYLHASFSPLQSAAVLQEQLHRLSCLTTFLPHFVQFLHESIHDEVVAKLAQAYAQVRIGDPWDRKQLFSTPEFRRQDSICFFLLNSEEIMDQSYLILAVYQRVGITGFVQNANSERKLKNPANTAHLGQIK